MRTNCLKLSSSWLSLKSYISFYLTATADEHIPNARIRVRLNLIHEQKRKDYYIILQYTGRNVAFDLTFDSHEMCDQVALQQDTFSSAQPISSRKAFSRKIEQFSEICLFCMFFFLELLNRGGGII